MVALRRRRRRQPLRGAQQVDRGNVGSLEVAWEFHSGDMADKPEAVRRSALEVTPILVRDKLIYCTPFNRIIALDPGRGTKLWEYDAQISLEQKPANRSCIDSPAIFARLICASYSHSFVPQPG